MKIQEILADFSVYELNRLRKYVASPFFNEKSAVLVFLDCILPYLKQKNKDFPTKSDIWQAINPETTYNDTHFRRISSDLVQLTLDFLAYLEIEKNNTLLPNAVLPALRQRNLDKQHERSSQIAANLLAKATAFDADFYYQNFVLAENINIFLQQNAQRTAENNLAAATKNLDIFYIAKRLKFFCNIMTLQNVLKIEMEMVGFAQITALAELPEYHDLPLIKLYFSTLQILLHPDDNTYFENLKAVLNTHKNTIPIAEQRDLYTLALNYCIRKINLGDTNFYAEIFGLYQFVLAEKILLKAGELQHWDYKNIVTLGLRLHEYAWIEGFIQNYTPLLPLNFRENALNYNLAKLNFAQKNYPKVITLLQNVAYQDIFYSLDSRALLVKTYYETDETDALDAVIESFRIFLVREKTVSETTRRQFLNFLKFTRRLVNRSEKSAVKKMQQKINETPEVADRQWLLAKTEEWI
jgi:hypothetical protein